MSKIIKVALDTNFIIKLCKNNNIDLLRTVLDQLSKPSPIVKGYIQTRSIEEFKKKASTNEISKFYRLMNVCDVDKDRFFTIGNSVIGSSDKIPFDNYNELTEDYNETKFINSGSNKSRSDWTISKQGDATIVSFATEKGCQLIVTDDMLLQKNSPQLINIPIL